MGTDTKPQQAQKGQESQKQQGNEKEKQGDGPSQGAGKRKPQDRDNKERNKRRRSDKPAVIKGIRFRILCYEGQAGAVIGKGGETVRSIRKTSSAEVAVLPPIQGHRLRVIVIDSSPGSRGSLTYPAKEALLACATLAVEGDQPLNTPDPSKPVEVRLLVQSELAAGLLGFKHSLGSLTAGDISARCGANVIMPPDNERPKLALQDEEYVLLRGAWPAVYAALGMVADELRRQFFELREPPGEMPLGPPPAGYGFPGGPPMGPPMGPFDPLEAMQLGIGLGMEMAVAAGVAAAGPHLGGPPPGHGNAPISGGGNGGGGPVPHGGDLSIAGLVPEFRSPADASMAVTVTFKLVVPENKAGRFIGKGGENLREMRQMLGLSTLKVHPAVKDTAVRVLEVTSTEPAAATRCAAVEALLYYVDRLGAATPQNAGGTGGRNTLTVKMLLHQQHCGPVVGPRAAVIRQVSALTKTSCVVHKKGDMPPYGSPEEQELEAEGDLPNVLEAIRMVAAIVRGSEMRRHGITVRETIGTPEFDLVRGTRGGGGGGPPPFSPMGPMVSAARSGMEPEGGWVPPDGDGRSGPPVGGQPGPSMPPPHLRPMQQTPQQQAPTQSHGNMQSNGPMGQPHHQLPPHLQKQPHQPSAQLGVDTSAEQVTAASSNGPIVAALPPLGPNDVRLTIFVAAALVNAPEGINGTNVQQVQAVTNTVVTLRQPVASGDYELDITGAFTQVMQAHTLLSNIMTIGAILQQKPQLAPQQAPPPAVAVGTAGSVGAVGVSGQAATATASAPVTTASGAQHQVVVQPNQGVVIASHPPPQQQPQSVAMRSPGHSQQGASQQQQQPQPASQPTVQMQGAPPAVQAAPSQAPAGYSGTGQQVPQQQQQASQQRSTQQSGQGGPQQQQQVQQQRPQQYPYSTEPTASAQQDPATQRQAQAQQQTYTAQQRTYTAQQPAQSQPSQQQQSLGQGPAFPQTPTQVSAVQQQQQYSQPYTQAYTQHPQSQQHPYYAPQQAQQPQANPYAAYGSQGYGAASGNAQAPATASAHSGSQAQPASTYDSHYAQATAAATSPPAASGAASGPTSAAAGAVGPYGQQQQPQQQYPGYASAGYQQSAPPQSHPYYQQALQQQQQPGAPTAHEQYYMHVQQQYAAYQAAAAATAGGAYTQPAYVYGYGAAPMPAPAPAPQ